MRKDVRYCKDMRVTKYTYYNGCFLILLLIESRLGTFPLNNLFTLFINMKTKEKNICCIHILKKRFKFIQNNNNTRR